jgi:hypothetical protein
MEPETAITRFALAELAAAARRMAHRLRRIPASGIYGDAHRHRTLWDELRFAAANGPGIFLEDAWEQTLRDICKGVLEGMPGHSKALLSWHLTSLGESTPDDAIDEAALRDAVCTAVMKLAGEG